MSIHTFIVKPNEGKVNWMPAVSQKPFVQGVKYTYDSEDKANKDLIAALQGDSTFEETIAYTDAEKAVNESAEAEDKLLTARFKADAAREAARKAQATADAAIAEAAEQAKAAQKEIEKLEADLARREADAKAEADAAAEADASAKKAAEAEAKKATKAAEKT